MTLTKPYEATFQVGDGETKDFPFYFDEVSENFIRVIIKRADGSIYYPTFSVDMELLRVVFGEDEITPTPDDVICIYRDTPAIQDTQFNTLQGYNAKALENILSKIVAMIQEMKANGFSTQILQGEPWSLDLIKPADDGASVQIDYQARVLKKGLYFKMSGGNLLASPDGVNFVQMPKSENVAEFRQYTDDKGNTHFEYRVGDKWFGLATSADIADAYTKTEVDNKFAVANAQIDANATAMQKTRDDMTAEDSRLQTQITAQATEIANKQDKLTAGDNIIISGNVISATGGGGITEVVHDDTLTGNGTTDSPLSVVGGGTGTDDYTQLLNKPEINGNVLTGNKTASQLGFATVATSGKYSDLSNKPTINDLTTTAQQNAINSTITSSLVSSYSNHIADTDIHVTAEQKTAWSNKQDSLVSGTNIKTINNNSLLGSGNINIDSLPEQTGNAGKVLTTDGTTASWQEPAGGTKVIFREWE